MKHITIIENPTMPTIFAVCFALLHASAFVNELNQDTFANNIEQIPFLGSFDI